MSDKWLKAECLAKKIIIFIILGGFGVALFMLTPKIISLLIPFVVAYIISLIASPLTHVFEKIHLPSALSAIISILVVAMVLFGVSALIINKIVSEVYDFFLNLPLLSESVAQTFSDLRIAALDIFKLLPDELAGYAAAALEGIQGSFSGISNAVIGAISNATINFFSHIPGILISAVFSILASYFLIRDKRKVKHALSHLAGERITKKYKEIKSYLSGAVFAYIRAQSILMSITFTEVFIGLSILRVRYSFLIAIVVAIVDAIPVFGTGTILIPWALYHLITGSYALTIGLAVIYGICLLMRQFLEPKILSSQIGIHPLVTLLAMYLGYRTIGVFGMILGPVVALVAKNIMEKYKEAHEKSE